MQLRRHSAKARALARGGFTLMELLVVVAILVILAGSAIFAFRRVLFESRDRVAEAQCKTLKQQLETFAMLPSSNMQYPDPGAGWEPLLAAGLVTKLPVDPWGQPYRWNLIPGPDGGPMVIVWSCGPDLQDQNGGGDDIHSER